MVKKYPMKYLSEANKWAKLEDIERILEAWQKQLEELFADFPKQNTKDQWGFEGKDTGRIVFTGYNDREIEEWRKKAEELLKL